MSTVLSVNASDINKALSSLNPLFPKGSSEMPLGLHVSNGHLKIVCLQGVVYQASITINDELYIEDVTIIYHDISPLLTNSGEVNIEFTPVSVVFSGDGFEAEFHFGYSVVAEQDFSKLVFSTINSQVYIDGMNRLLNMGLDKLYNKNYPIIVKKDIALQKCPNTWIQVRTTGLPFAALLDTNQTKLLMKFMPNEVCVSVQGTLVFRNRTAYLQIPCNVNNDTDDITEVMQDLGDPVTVNIRAYLDRVRNMAKVSSKAHCKITIYANGLKTAISYNDTSISVSAGKVDNTALKVCSLPVQLWLAFLKCLGSEQIQILVGSDKICLRTNQTIIVTHVLL